MLWSRSSRLPSLEAFEKGNKYSQKAQPSGVWEMRLAAWFQLIPDVCAARERQMPAAA